MNKISIMILPKNGDSFSLYFDTELFVFFAPFVIFEPDQPRLVYSSALQPILLKYFAISQIFSFFNCHSSAWAARIVILLFVKQLSAAIHC